MSLIKSIFLFITAALFEIGGVYFIWKYFKVDKNLIYLFGGFTMLIIYGIIGTNQVFSFGKSYVIYGGVFILMALAWVCMVDNYRPRINEILGILVIVSGILIMLFQPISNTK